MKQSRKIKRERVDTVVRQMFKRYGYDGFSSQRVVAVKEGHRKVLAWGDEINVEELGHFIMGWPDHEIEIENVDNPTLEQALHPLGPAR